MLIFFLLFVTVTVFSAGKTTEELTYLPESRKYLHFSFSVETKKKF